MTALIAFFDIVLAVGAFIGGKSLTNDPTGSQLKMPLKWLKKVPLIHSYMLPGIFLLVVFALLGSVAAVGTIYGFDWSDDLNIVLGLILMTWIIVELIFIPAKNILQLFYFFLGLILVMLSLI